MLSGRIDTIRAQTRITRIGFALPQGTTPPDWLAATPDGTRWQSESTDSDALLRRMVAEALPFRDLTLQPLDLKDLIHRLRHKEARP